MNATGPWWWLVNIGTGKGLVLSGNKPITGTGAIVDPNLWSLGHNELKYSGLHKMDAIL